MNKVSEILRAIGEAGKNEDGSYTRICYSKEYFEAVDIVERHMKSLGMETFRDAAGNIRGVLPGADKSLRSIVTGSHLDTVPNGGLFDGAYGVAGGLETVRRLKEEGVKLRHTFEVYGFNAEESNPLGGTFGSRAITGLVSPEQPGLKEALKQYGVTLDEIMACKRDFSEVKCYLELHVEQGDYLYNEGIDVGVVSGIVGVIRYKITSHGSSNHAGTTMMQNRRDALVAMAHLICEADERCRRIDDRLVMTVGTIECWPGAGNVIPGKVECTFEMRHMDGAKTDELIEEIRKIAAKIETAEFEIVNLVNKGAVLCDEHIMSVIGNSAKEAGVSQVVMPSGAGHDANPIAHRTPIGMIFVPSKEGLSHCPEEWTEDSDLEKGADVLYRTVLALDKED
jgi:hydantoinase/carbamoylase family amidase